jgi:threonine/homoserine/homoserine lactone efflux protein
MTTYISLATALQILENAFVFSAILLVGVSYLGWAAIETIEKITD